MKKSIQKMKKVLVTGKTGGWMDFIPIAYALAYLVFLIGVIAFMCVDYFLKSGDMLSVLAGDEDVGAFLYKYVRFAGIWPAVIVCMLMFKRNRKMLTTLSYRKDGNNIRGAMFGLLLGFVTNGACALMSWLMGDIVLMFNGFNPMLLIIFLAAVLIQSGAEELVNRGLLYQKLRRGYSQPWVAIIMSALFFALLHMQNTGINAAAIAQIVAVGVLYALFVYYYDCLWAAITMHTAWNFTQNIIFGLPNSGIVSEYSVFTLDAATARSGLFYDKEFGIEGSTGSVVILGILCVLVFLSGRKNGERRNLWTDQET